MLQLFVEIPSWYTYFFKSKMVTRLPTGLITE